MKTRHEGELEQRDADRPDGYTGFAAEPGSFAGTVWRTLPQAMSSAQS